MGRMRNVAQFLLALLFVGCGNSNDQAPGNAQLFISSTIQMASADAHLAVLATRRGELPETRELGAIVHRAQSEMGAELTAIARRRNVPLPSGIAQAKVALRNNLMILQGSLFDRAYALAMVQDMNSMLQNFQTISRSDDAELRQFVRKYQPSLAEQQRSASRLLNQLGGSPFGIPP